MFVNIGDKIKITYMNGEPQETGKVGIVKYVDDFGQYHGTWSGLAVIPDMDEFEVIERADNVQSKTN